MDTYIKSAFEETSIPNVTVNISNMDTNIDSGDQSQTNIPEKTLVIPSRFSNTESHREEVKIPYITMDLSNKETNVNMDEGIIHVESFVAT